ncbi:MarR family winged helix-turn-helix transcriptional regulator [Tateyamaria omphalii]|uniref:MarR family winged helix-turn-helix transcriptional regulator n=1 Tax=Tateyamaria omphalii TaxID=299262 RepID=UPI001C9A0CF8|nr:MarR family winged helix-turn-helix transcriptional regulator [Tateyamaria omphalii]MBY5932729.1 MarR family winged helix-turn-helix transcriptional regulator [Tateyamaria omphalii]
MSKGFVKSYLLYLLAACSETASAEFHAKVRKSGLRVPEWRVLACLNDEDGQMITHLAHVALAEQSRLTRIIDGMVKRDLLERRSDKSDGRRVRIYLTDKGRAIATDLVEQAKAHETDLLSRLPEAQVSALKPALTTLLEVLEQKEGETHT